MAPTRTKRTSRGSRAREASVQPSTTAQVEQVGDLQDFNRRVYEMVRRVPEGQVSSYGDIARFLARPQNSRLVGAAMKHLPSSLSSPYLPQPLPPSSSDTDTPLPPPEPNPEFVPWHRIVSSSGVISPRGNERGMRRQAEFLTAEGVEVMGGPRAGGGANGRDGVDAFGLGGAGRDGGRVRMVDYRWEGPDELRE